MGNLSSSPRRNSSNQNPRLQNPPPYGYYPPAPQPTQNYGYSNGPYAPLPHLTPNYNYPGWYFPHQPSTPYYTPGLGSQTSAPAQPPPPYVQENTKKIKNDVNVHKDSIRLEIDMFNPDQYLVSFVLDAMFDGSITIYYFAKEDDNCKLTPLMPEAFQPVNVPFQKGLGQKFCQPSGTGIDLGFFDLDDLAKPSADGEAYPLVISAQVCSVTHQTGEEDGSTRNSSPSFQITQAVIKRNNGEPFQVKVVKQILWIDRVRYEIRELYGIADSSEQEFTDDGSGKECVICMSEPKDTAVIPCRHMLCQRAENSIKQVPDLSPTLHRALTDKAQ
ncbi:hypothetical protein V2J09_017910 [Rumex salicifolius]